jgi:chlorite dismutase
MSEPVYMYIQSLTLTKEWWKISHSEKKAIVDELSEFEKKIQKNIIIKRFLSLRYDSDLIYWINSKNTKDIREFRYKIFKIFRGLIKENLGMLSIFKPSPYVNYKKFEPWDYIKQEPLRYFIAYPMKKSPEWYLLPFNERKELIEEHAKIASEINKYGIRSYTTYSFGIGDNEFVVIYESPTIEGWSYVVEKLREARARKWTIREEPIIIGELGNLEELI